MALVTAILAFVMIFNNYFGFTGLQRFAQYVAVPVVVAVGHLRHDQGLHHGDRAISSRQFRTRRTPELVLFVAGAMVGPVHLGQ